jgi:RimJ/RimL family protein N-acetyltransferase
MRIKADWLVLRVPREGDLPALVEAARTLRDAPRYQLNYLYDDSPAMERGLLQRYWRALAHWTPDSWHLILGIFIDGEPVGLQEMWADGFARLRSAETSSWVRSDLQGGGIGTRARAGVLELAFAELGATEAHTAYLTGNQASRAVSRKLGYRDNGFHNVHRNGETRRNNRMILELLDWEADRPSRLDIRLTGADRALFGVTD